VRIAGLALLFTLFSVLPGRADLAPKWSDAELLGFSNVVVTGTVAAVSTGWDARTVYTYVTLDVGDVIKGWIPERQIILKLLGGRVDDLALIVGGQAAFTVGEHVLVFLEARRGDRTLATTALWQGKWTISTDSVSGQRLATRRLPSTPDRRAFGPGVDVRALEPWLQMLRAQAGQTGRAPTGAEPAVIVQPRDARAARPVFDVDATAVMSGVWHDADRDHESAPRLVVTADCFTRFRDYAVTSWATGDPCGDMGAAGGTLAISGYWARTTVGARSGPVEPFMQIVQSGIITNAGAPAATYLSQPSCANQISAHELAHARGRSHSQMPIAVLDRSCATPRVESQRDASMRVAAAAESATMTGSTFTIAWDAPDSGAPRTYVVEAGSAPGLVNLARFETGGTGTSYLATAVAPGTYYVRVRAASDDGISSPSNEVSVTVVPTGPMPDAPTSLVATAIGSTVTFAWTAPAGTVASDYRVEAGSAPGLSDLANFATGSAATRFMATGVGAGTFFIRVRAVNAAGVGSASNEVRLVVTDASAPCAGAPGAPRGLTAVVTGSTVTLAWTASEGAPTSYVIEAGSSTGSTDLANFDTARTSPSLRVTGVGNGAYFVRVRAKNACGASPPSNEVLVTVQ